MALEEGGTYLRIKSEISTLLWRYRDNTLTNKDEHFTLWYSEVFYYRHLIYSNKL